MRIFDLEIEKCNSSFFEQFKKKLSKKKENHDS